MKKAVNWLADRPMLLGCVAVVVLAVFVVLKLRSFQSTTEAEASGRLGPGVKVVHTPSNRRTLMREAEKADRAAARAERRRASSEKVRYADDGSVDKGEYDGFVGKDRELAKKMDDCFWDDDMEGVLVAARAAADSSNVELREKAIERLAWYDVDGLADLVAFLADPDEKLAAKAVAAWTDGLVKIDDDEERANIVRKMATVLRNESAISSMLVTTGNASDLATMQIIVDVIDTGTEEAMAAARDYYEFMTGEEFTTIEAAENWLVENGDLTQEINAADEGDVDAIAAAAGMTREQYWERLESEAARENMTMEEFVLALKETAEENGQSITDYLIEKETELAGERKDEEATDEN